MEINQICNICFTNLNNKVITEDIIDVVADTLTRSGLLVLREEGITSDYLRIYKEDKNEQHAEA